MKTVGDVLDRIADLDRRLITAVKRCEDERKQASKDIQEAVRLECVSTTEARLTLESAENRKDKCNQARRVVDRARENLHSIELDRDERNDLNLVLNEAESFLNQWGHEH